MNWFIRQINMFKKAAVLCAAALFAMLCAGDALAATIETVSPENVTINLFDYWITKEENGDIGMGPSGAGRFVWDSQLPVGHLETGINQNHAFKFGGSGSALEGEWKNVNGTLKHQLNGNIVTWSNAGYWNNGTGFGFALVDNEKVEAYIKNAGKAFPGLEGLAGATGYTKDVGIPGKTLVNRGLFLKNTLDANGYPQLDLNASFANVVKYITNDSTLTSELQTALQNTGLQKPKANESDSAGQYGPVSLWRTNWWEESLQYLFDPAEDHVGKASFADVKKLLKVTKDGYYRFSSYENFAEFVQSGNVEVETGDATTKSIPSGYFHVYSDKGINASGASPDGQFYPFNTAEKVLKDGTYNDRIMSLGDHKPGYPEVDINHFVGMTMEVPFQQPINGQIGFGTDAKPMVFKFSGDDDTLIYIDNVLVADLSGCHDAITVHIDFSTGEIKQFFSPSNENGNDPLIPKKDGVDVPVNTSNLLAQYIAADKQGTTQWHNNTFASGTVHTLKLFYLERGHTDSNLTLEFNLVQAAESALHKHNQDGESLTDSNDLELTLYKLDETSEQDILSRFDSNGQYTGTLDESRKIRVFDHASTKIQGGEQRAWQIDDIRSLISAGTISDGYFLLRETKTPAGYRPVRDVLLYYDKDGVGLLHVKNQWTTGARSSFRENSHTLDDKLHYYNYVDLDKPVMVDNPERGLAVAVPLMRTSYHSWSPLYGNHVWGYTTSPAYNEGKDPRHNELMAVLDAALHQIYYTHHGDEDYQNYGEKWILAYDSLTDRYQSVLKNLPGDIEQYEWVYTTEAEKQAKASMAMIYYYFDTNALMQLGATTEAGQSLAKWEDIADYIKALVGANETIANVDAQIKKLVIQLIGQQVDSEHFHRLHRDNFETVYTPDIYVPNIVNELRVCKLDHTQSEREKRTVTLEGAQFGLYADAECTQMIAQGTTDDNGMLIFSAEQTDGNGTAHAVLETNQTYYLREIGGTNGVATFNGVVYAINDSIVEVKVTRDGVFANATAYGEPSGVKDGIGVWIGTGKVVETMAMYAAGGSLNDSLVEIQAELMVRESIDAKDRLAADIMGNRNLALTYEEKKAFLQYAPMETGGHNYFTIYDGYGHAHITQFNPNNNPNDDRENLEGYNIDPLFTGSTTVMVSNRRLTDQYGFSGSKMLIGRELYPGEFQFDLYQATDHTFNKAAFVERVSNDVHGTFDFKYQKIVDKKISPQYFYYVIEECTGDLPGMTYDPTRYGVMVVAQGHNQSASDGTYEHFYIDTIYYKLDEKGNATRVDGINPVQFVNTFVTKAPPAAGDKADLGPVTKEPPKTGDKAALGLYAVLAAVSASCAAVLLYRRRRRSAD